jgi:hypothetical protein
MSRKPGTPIIVLLFLIPHKLLDNSLPLQSASVQGAEERLELQLKLIPPGGFAFKFVQASQPHHD